MPFWLVLLIEHKVLHCYATNAVYTAAQCLKWKIRGEGTVRQLWASKQVVLAPDRFL